MVYILNFFVFIACILRFAGCNSTVEASNEFVDNLFKVWLQSGDRVIDGLTIGDWELTEIKSTHILNRAITGRFEDGIIGGLGTIQRKGDCEPTVRVNEQIILRCRSIDLSGIYAIYHAKLYGTSLFGSLREKVLKVTFNPRPNVLELVTVGQGRPILQLFSVGKIKFDVNTGGLRLNAYRDHVLRDQIRKQSVEELRKMFAKFIPRTLNDTLATMQLPLI